MDRRESGPTSTAGVPHLEPHLGQKTQDKCRKSQSRVMADHKFREGQRVTLAANIINRTAIGGSYIVVKQLPH
jgi:hypothetical protein